MKLGDQEIPFPFCDCKHGWTGPFCDVSTLQDAVPYYPPVDSKASYYSKDDPFEDHHPFFNISTLTTFHITLPPEDYIYHVLAENSYNQSYTRVNVTFYGGSAKKYIFPSRKSSLELLVSKHIVFPGPWHTSTISLLGYISCRRISGSSFYPDSGL